MRLLSVLLAVFLAGCSAGIVYKSAPATVINAKEASRVSGVFQPYGVYFTAVSYFDGTSARVVVLSELGSKMLDMKVTADEIQVYEKLPQLPARAAGAFGRFVRAQLFTKCPAENLTFKDLKSRGTFQATATGGVLCD